MEATPLAAVAATKTLAETNLKAPELVAETVGLLKKLPGIRPSESTQNFLEATAYLATVFREVPGATVAGVPEHVIYAAKMLIHRKTLSLHSYYRALDGCHELVQIVKVCEHVVKLRHAPEGHLRSETEGFVKALTLDMGEPWKTYLEGKLDEATAKQQ